MHSLLDPIQRQPSRSNHTKNWTIIPYCNIFNNNTNTLTNLLSNNNLCPYPIQTTAFIPSRSPPQPGPLRFHAGTSTKLVPVRPNIIRARPRPGFQNQLRTFSSHFPGLPLVSFHHISGGRIRNYVAENNDFLIAILFTPIHLPINDTAMYCDKPEKDQVPYNRGGRSLFVWPGWTEKKINPTLSPVNFVVPEPPNLPNDQSSMAPSISLLWIVIGDFNDINSR